MLDTRGDTAIYLLFTCARFHSILRKAEEEKGINVKELVATKDIILEHPVSHSVPDTGLVRPLCFFLPNLMLDTCTPLLDTTHTGGARFSLRNRTIPRLLSRWSNGVDAKSLMFLCL